MDILKHGESAYPADAWVEQQYMKDGAGTLSLVSATLAFPNLRIKKTPRRLIKEVCTSLFHIGRVSGIHYVRHFQNTCSTYLA